MLGGKLKELTADLNWHKGLILARVEHRFHVVKKLFRPDGSVLRTQEKPAQLHTVFRTANVVLEKRHLFTLSAPRCDLERGAAQFLSLCGQLMRIGKRMAANLQLRLGWERPLELLHLRLRLFSCCLKIVAKLAPHKEQHCFQTGVFEDEPKSVLFDWHERDSSERNKARV